MACLTIRNLDEKVKQNLRIKAARHGFSMEEEARQILRLAVLEESSEKGLGSFIHQKFNDVGGFELEPIARSTPRDPGLFGEK